MCKQKLIQFQEGPPIKWVVLGLDIGLTGCCAALSDSGRVINYRRTIATEILGKKPIRKTNKAGVRTVRIPKRAYGADLFNYLQGFKTFPILAAFVEEPLQMRVDGGGPKIQSSTITSLWHSLGVAEGVLSCFGIKSYRIQPRAWKAQYGLIKEPKRASVERAVILNPELGKLLVKEADIAEAVLIGRYGLKYQRERYQSEIPDRH